MSETLGCISGITVGTFVGRKGVPHIQLTGRNGYVQIECDSWDTVVELVKAWRDRVLCYYCDTDISKVPVTYGAGTYRTCPNCNTRNAAVLRL